MTDPDHSALDADLAAYEQAVASNDAALAATVAALQQQLADETAKDDQDRATITALQAQVAQLEAEIAALQSKVLYGSGFGGWFTTLGESKQSAYNRIVKAFAPDKGYLDVVRLFSSSLLSYIDPRTKVFWEPSGGINQATIQQLAARGPGQYISEMHEPEDKNISIADWQALQAERAALVKQHGGGNVSLVPVLMSMSFIPSRNPPYPASAWFAGMDMTNIDYIGADAYQHGTSDVTADTVDVFIQPVLDLARALGKKSVFGELGFRRVTPPNSLGISDAKRAQTAQAAIALFDANADVVEAVMPFESDSGKPAYVPWPMTHPTNPNYSPLAVSAWASACNR